MAGGNTPPSGHGSTGIFRVKDSTRKVVEATTDYSDDDGHYQTTEKNESHRSLLCRGIRRTRHRRGFCRGFPGIRFARTHQEIPQHDSQSDHQHDRENTSRFSGASFVVITFSCHETHLAESCRYGLAVLTASLYRQKVP